MPEQAHLRGCLVAGVGMHCMRMCLSGAWYRDETLLSAGGGVFPLAVTAGQLQIQQSAAAGAGRH
jgi:hypothetical protein